MQVVVGPFSKKMTRRIPTTSHTPAEIPNAASIRNKRWRGAQRDLVLDQHELDHQRGEQHERGDVMQEGEQRAHRHLRFF